METPEEYKVNQDYYSVDALSSSEISLFLRDPISWWHRYKVGDWTFDPTPEMRLGTQIHQMIELGGPEHLGLIDRPPECDLRKKEWKQWKAEQEAAGLEIVDSSGLRVHRTIWEHLMASEFTRHAVQRSEKEQEHVWANDEGCRCKVKFDAIVDQRILLDWKTTTDVTPRRFAQECVNRRYIERLAFYRWGFENLYGRAPVDVYIVAIQKVEPFRVIPYRIDPAWLDDAEARVIMAIDEMDRFNMAQFLDQDPLILAQPIYAQLKFDKEE